MFNFEQKVKNGKRLQGDKINFFDFSNRWLVEYGQQQLEKSTYNNYIQHLKFRINPAIGHLKLVNITPLHLQTLYNSLTKDGNRADGKAGSYSHNTIKKCHAIISSILKSAMQWQIVESNPCDRVAVPKQVNNNDNVKFFTLEQAELFLQALDMDITTTYKAHARIDDTGKTYRVSDYTETRTIPEQLKVFFYIALFGGFRRGELIALTWDDIDFSNNSIAISKSTIYTNKETITKAKKNKTSNRSITLPDSIIKMIKRYQMNQYQYRLSIGDKWQGDNYIFIQWNGKQMNPSTPYQTFKKVIKRYNETITNEDLKLPNIPLHGLRHTSATLLIFQNMDIRTVSGRLGHAQTSTTMNIYAHNLHKKDEEAAESLDKYFSDISINTK